MTTKLQERLTEFREVALEGIPEGSYLWKYSSESFEAGWMAALTVMTAADDAGKRRLIREFLDFMGRVAFDGKD